MSHIPATLHILTKSLTTKKDAWARIRTWEPLREGILSPSPLTKLGYPRAPGGESGPRKAFPVIPRLQHHRGTRSHRHEPHRTVQTKGFSHPRGLGTSGLAHGAIFHEGLLRRGRDSPACR